MITIHDAVKSGDLATLKILLSKNPKLLDCRHVKTDFTPLCYAVISERLACLDTLILEGADLNIQIGNLERTPLILAVIFGKEKSIQRLLTENELEPNLTDTDGNTALMQAILLNDKPMVSLLAPHTRHSIPNYEGKTALTLTEDPEINDILISHSNNARLQSS